MHELSSLGLPFLLAGTYAVSAYTGITRPTKDLDIFCKAGDYPRILRMAVEAIDLPSVRKRQSAGEADGRLIGLGISIFSEQTAHGTTADGKRRALYEQAFARLTPDGRLDLRLGIQSIGQGLETTLAQIAHEGLPRPHVLAHGLRNRRAAMGLCRCRRRRRVEP